MVEKLELAVGPVLLLDDTPRLGTLLRVGVGFEVRTLLVVVDWVAMELVEFERAGLAGRWVCWFWWFCCCCWKWMGWVWAWRAGEMEWAKPGIPAGCCCFSRFVGAEAVVGVGMGVA